MLAGTAAALALAAPAAAQDQSKPVPTCEMAFADAAGDVTTAGAENLDLIGGFFTYEEDGSVRANLSVKNLHSDYPGAANGIRWRLAFHAAGRSYYVGAFRDVIFQSLADPYYEWGTIDGGTATFQGIATGAMHTGENGVLQVVVPPEVGLADGLEVSDISAVTQSYTTLGIFETTVSEDGNDEDASPFTVGVCPDLPLAIRLTSRPPRASQVARTRRFTIGIAGSVALTDASVELSRGKTVYAKGSYRRLGAAGRLTMKTARKVRKGRYVLAIGGTTPSGRRGSTTINVRLR